MPRVHAARIASRFAHIPRLFNNVQLAQASKGGFRLSDNADVCGWHTNMLRTQLVKRAAKQFVERNLGTNHLMAVVRRRGDSAWRCWPVCV